MFLATRSSGENDCQVGIACRAPCSWGLPDGICSMHREYRQLSNQLGRLALGQIPEVKKAKGARLVRKRTVHDAPLFGKQSFDLRHLRSYCGGRRANQPRGIPAWLIDTLKSPFAWTRATLGIFNHTVVRSGLVATLPPA